VQDSIYERDDDDSYNEKLNPEEKLGKSQSNQKQ
jgi:hypothetical protein